MSTLRFSSASTVNHQDLENIVKSLFFQRRYKVCASRCLHYLKVHGEQVYFYFLAGISNDAYARGMSLRSPLIPSSLDEAEAFFSKAQDLLITARIVHPRTTGSLSMNQPSTTSDNAHSDDGRSSRSLHRSRHSEDSNSRPSTAATTVSMYSNADTDILCYNCEDKPGREKPHRPGPLNVRKYQPLPDSPSKPLPSSTSLFSPGAISPHATTSRPSPRLASFYLLRFPPSQALPSEPSPTSSPLLRQSDKIFGDKSDEAEREDDSRDSQLIRLSLLDSWMPSIATIITTKSDEQSIPDTPFPDEDFSFHEPSHIDIYNTQLAAFAVMLSTHIDSLRRFRGQIAALNATRSGLRDFDHLHLTTPSVFDAWNRGKERGDEQKKQQRQFDMPVEERMQRIIRGRMRNWERERFDPTRIRGLCEIALAEL